MQLARGMDVGQLAGGLLDVMKDDVVDTTGMPVKVETALVVVHDQRGLRDLAKYFVEKGIHVISEGSTLTKLRDLGCTVQSTEDFLGSPTLLEGKDMKINKKLRGSLEAKEASEDIRPIQLVVWNLFPFEECAVESDDFNPCIENMDVNGPPLMKASAMNSARVAIATDPEQYETLIGNMQHNDGCTSIQLRKEFAKVAVEQTDNLQEALTAWTRWASSEQGKVKNWNNEKSFGFIVPDEGGQDLFAHASGLLGGMSRLDQGDRVTFIRQYNDKNGKDKAVDIKKMPIGSGPKLVEETFKGEMGYWNDEKGYGFIIQEDDPQDIFCHVSNILGGKDAVKSGDKVTYSKQYNENKGKHTARNVCLATGASPATTAAGEATG